jgi:hypothetical protein
LRNLRQAVCDVVAVIGGDPLQAADRDRLFLDPGTAAGGLTRPVAHPAENAGEDVRVPVHHVRVGEAALRNQTDVFGNIGVSRTGPLAIHDTMVVVGMRGIGRFHSVPASGGRPS